MLKNRWLLASVAFSVSFMISLVVNRDIKTALVTGVIAVPAIFCGVIAVNIQQRIRKKRIINILERQIIRLEEWGEDLYEYLLAMAAEQQRREINLNSLKRQINQIYIQISEQQKYKYQLNQELIKLSEQKRKLEAEVHHWETQLYHLEQRREELDLSLRSLASEKHNAEVKLSSLQTEIQLLEFQIYGQSSAESEPEATAEPQPQFEIVFDEQPSQSTDDEWQEFISQLTNSELEVLKAILQEENPNPTIKKIAETYITMPELLVDAINQRAIATIGDIIIEPGSVPPIISEDEYLIKLKEKLSFVDERI
ncbi:MAG TPA: tellurite resistance TerB C-terminal domain-containing protein [Leptolyngbyaceae cyanobacterium]